MLLLRLTTPGSMSASSPTTASRWASSRARRSSFCSRPRRSVRSTARSTPGCAARFRRGCAFRSGRRSGRSSAGARSSTPTASTSTCSSRPRSPSRSSSPFPRRGRRHRAAGRALVARDAVAEPPAHRRACSSRRGGDVRDPRRGRGRRITLAVSAALEHAGPRRSSAPGRGVLVGRGRPGRPLDIGDLEAASAASSSLTTSTGVSATRTSRGRTPCSASRARGRAGNRYEWLGFASRRARLRCSPCTGRSAPGCSCSRRSASPARSAAGASPGRRLRRTRSKGSRARRGATSRSSPSGRSTSSSRR